MTSRRFVNALRTVINEHSKEGDSNTPDFVLARFLAQSLEAFALAVTHRDDWYAVDEIAEEAKEAALLKTNLRVLAKAALTYVTGPKFDTGKAYDDLVAALRLPVVQKALGITPQKED